MYTCETCNYKTNTKYKTNLKSHLLVHRQSSEVEMYTCETCNHKTKYKWALKKNIFWFIEKIMK
ncbi:hypothetical protein NQ317_009168 [Molorchus minor]|uniref:C2H2-type domain-containing protein n=1 Tax=Molorchus minor TaxID=1323400 RepID=A0ABQ9JZF3_9CUCU|nr:hypothetical protein NQ317_009168 [Molorchus minor]